jgi:hypothetical protein
MDHPTTRKQIAHYHADVPWGYWEAAMARLVASCLLGLSLSGSLVAAAASPFDGAWVGTGPSAGDCGVITVTLAVNDGLISGTVKGSHGIGKVIPTQVAPDGSAQVSYYKFKGTLKLSGNTLAGTFDGFCGLRNVTGAKQQ